VTNAIDGIEDPRRMDTIRLDEAGNLFAYKATD
jgi:hypothetical protein